MFASLVSLTLTPLHLTEGYLEEAAYPMDTGLFVTSVFDKIQSSFPLLWGQSTRCSSSTSNNTLYRMFQTSNLVLHKGVFHGTVYNELVIEDHHTCSHDEPRLKFKLMTLYSDHHSVGCFFPVTVPSDYSVLDPYDLHGSVEAIENAAMHSLRVSRRHARINRSSTAHQACLEHVSSAFGLKGF